MVKRILFVTNRKLNDTYGEDKALKVLIELVSRKHETYLLVIDNLHSYRIVDGNYVKEKLHKLMDTSFDMIILHSDKTLIGKLFVLKKLKITSSLYAMAPFIDTYSPTSFIKNVVGWFVLQPIINYFITYSKTIYRKMKKLGIIKVCIIPLTKLITRYVSVHLNSICKDNKKLPHLLDSNDNTKKGVTLCYFGVVDTERFDVHMIASIIKELKFLGVKSVNLIVLQRPRGENQYKRKYITLNNFSTVVIQNISSLLDDCSKLSILRNCDLAVFMAKKFRYLFPPMFILEAFSMNIPIFAPHIGVMLKAEGIGNVCLNITECMEILPYRLKEKA